MRPELAKRMHDNATQHGRLAILAEHRAGKSSLAPLLLPASFRVIDCKGTRSTLDFTFRIAEAIGTTIAEEHLRKQDLAETIVRLLGALDASAPHTTIVFDEIQDLHRLPREEARSLLTILHSSLPQSPQSAYIFLGSGREARLLFTHHSSPLYGHCTLLELSQPPRSQILDFLEVQFMSGDRNLPREIGSAILALAGDNLGDIQQLAFHLWEVSEPGQLLDMSSVRRALNLLLDHESRALDLRLSRTTPLQERVLFTLASLGGASVTTKAFLRAAGVPLRASAHVAAKALAAGDDPLLHMDGATARFAARWAHLGLLRRLIRQLSISKAIGIQHDPARIDPILHSLLIAL